MHELPDLSRLSVAEKDALIFAQFEQLRKVERLTVMVQMSARVRELEGRLHKDSHHASKPPSSDGLAKKPQSLRQSSGRQPGGQAGHAGTTLKAAANPEVMVQHPRCLSTVIAAVRTLRHTPRSGSRSGARCSICSSQCCK